MIIVDKKDTLYLTARNEWRSWLESNYDKVSEVWLIYPNKSSGKNRIQYNDAVEEALCFGWIDSTIKKLDKENAMQRFTPRRPKSEFSQSNRERLRWLLEHKLIHPSLVSAMQEIVSKEFIFPSDIMKVIESDQNVRVNFQGFSEGYKRLRISYINDARMHPDEFKRRLKNFIDKTRENKLINGFGGIEKYY